MTEQLAIDFVRARRDSGIKRSADHAGEAWKKRAFGYLLEFLTTRKLGETFLAEDVRDFAKNLDAPPDGRAWGHVMRYGAQRGFIVKVGYAPAKSSNLSAKVLWRPR